MHFKASKNFKYDLQNMQLKTTLLKKYNVYAQYFLCCVLYQYILSINSQDITGNKKKKGLSHGIKNHRRILCTIFYHSLSKYISKNHNSIIYI